MELLQVFPEDNYSPPWVTFPQRWPVLECRVDSLDFDFPTCKEFRISPSVIARLTLTVVGLPGENSFFNLFYSCPFIKKTLLFSSMVFHGWGQLSVKRFRCTEKY